MEFVNFNLAKKLKDLGFNEPCIYAYCEKGGWNMYTQKHEPITYILRTDGNPFGTYYTGKKWNKEYKTNKNKIQCSAPTISQVLKWLRDDKKIYVTVNVEREDWFEYKIVQTIKNTRCTGNHVYETYDDAMLTGIEYVLDNLI